MSLTRLGLLIPPMGTWDAQTRGYRRAEEIGYDVAYTADHLTHPTMSGEWLGEAFTTLTAAAAVTDRILLGTLVASSVFRTPVPLARIAMTVQDITGGRLVLGLGMGAPFCAEADRGSTDPISVMSHRYADVVRGYRAVLDGAVEWRGEVLSFGGLETTARPDGASSPELLLAGHGPRALALAAEYADTWNTYGGPGTAEVEGDQFWELLSDQVDAFDRACEAAERDPVNVRRSVLLGFGRVQPSAGLDSYLEAIDRAEALGFDEMVVYGAPWSDGEPADLSVHEQALARLR